MPAENLSIDSDHGMLSATLCYSTDSTHVLLLAHGAGADHTHQHMASLAGAFLSTRIATLRFNFPFKQQGRSRVDSKAVSIDCIANAANFLAGRMSLPLLAGGHSFGGRMTTHAVVDNKLECDALVLCSYPLHPAGKPSTDRATHLREIQIPMIFLSGTRDKLADRALLDPVVTELGPGNGIHWLDTGDHSFKILKRMRKSTDDIYQEAATATRDFVDHL